jgi:crotonobetaine/carnitine-CoA ligase
MSLVDRPMPSFGLGLEEMVISRLLEVRAREDPQRPFVVYGEDRWTFAEVERASGRLAAGLHGLGIARGDSAALFLPNGPEFVNSYFALGKLGATTIAVNTAYRGYMLEYLLNDTACRYLIVDGTLLDRVRESIERLPSLETIVVVGEHDGAQVGSLMPIAFGTLDGDGLETDPAVTYQDVNCVIYTSGTTGPSKGVPIINAHAVAKAVEVIRLCEMTADDVIYAPLPLFHSFALLRGVVAALVLRGTCALRERFSASSYWADVRELGATIGYCVFTIPQILKKAQPREDDRDHPLRCLYNARHDPEFEERFGVRLIEAYALTEAGVAMYTRPGDPGRPGSCGRVSEDWEVRLVDDDDVDVPVGEAGEIVLRPRYPGLITPGYLNKPEATVEAFRNLWFHTGDLATVDEDGYYYFRDRKKDAIRRRGENVSSWEVEQVLLEHPAIAEAAAVPYPSPLGEDDVRVVVSIREGAALEPEELIAYCLERLPDFMVPRYVELLSELPRTPTGRVEKYRLRGMELSATCYDRGDPREVARSSDPSAPA